MPRTKPPYAPEFRQQMVELVRAGRKPSELAREFKCTAQSIATWVAQAAADTGNVARELATTMQYKQSRRDRKKVEILFVHLKRILKVDCLRLREL